MTTIAADKAVVAAYNKAFPGGTSPFGAPNYVAAQVYATAAHGWRARTARSPAPSSARQVAKVKLGSTILGGPMSFTPNGDVAGAKFYVFKIAAASTRPSRSSTRAGCGRVRRPHPAVSCGSR